MTALVMLCPTYSPHKAYKASQVETLNCNNVLSLNSFYLCPYDWRHDLILKGGVGEVISQSCLKHRLGNQVSPYLSSFTA